MDFSLTDDQQLLRDTATKLLERECPPALVRAHIDDPSVYEPLWRHLREYTALGAGPATDLCLFLEQTGYVAAPGPFLATALYTSLDRRRRRDHRHRRVRRRPDEPVRARSRPRREDRDRRPRAVGRRRRHRRACATACASSRTIDFSRRVVPARHRATSTSNAQPSRSRDVRGLARPCARVDRGRDDRHRAAHLRHGARVREGAQAVRPADRLVPGDPAQARRHVARARSARPRRCSTAR